MEDHDTQGILSSSNPPLPGLVVPGMTPEEMRQRAGEAVAARMHELGLTATELAEKSSIDVTTVRALLRGRRRVREETWERVLAALDLPRSAVARQMWAVSQASTEDLIAELCRRFNPNHPRA